jgi:hypothetical protein
LPLKGEEMSQRLAGILVSLCWLAIAVWGVGGGMARLRSEEKGELRESVELLGLLSESSCGGCTNNGAISEPCVVCALPRLTSDDGGGDFAARMGS